MRIMLTNLEIQLLQKEIYEQISEILKLGVIYDLWSSLYDLYDLWSSLFLTNFLFTPCSMNTKC